MSAYVEEGYESEHGSTYTKRLCVISYASKYLNSYAPGSTMGAVDPLKCL